MISFKEKFIPVIILFGSLAIILFSYGWTNDEKPMEVNTNTNQEETEKVSLFKSILSTKSQKTEKLTKSQDNSNKQEQEINNPETPTSSDLINSVEYLTTESILSEIKSLSLSPSSYQPQDSKTCSLCSANEEYLEEALAMVGFLSWEEYFLSEDFKEGMAYYEANKELFWEDDYSTSLCENTLAFSGPGCTCDNAEGPCYTDTPYGRVWHCGGLCCCSCCVVCCGR